MDRNTPYRDGELNLVPVAAATEIFGGHMVTLTHPVMPFRYQCHGLTRLRWACLMAGRITAPAAMVMSPFWCVAANPF